MRKLTLILSLMLIASLSVLSQDTLITNSPENYVSIVAHPSTIDTSATMSDIRELKREITEDVDKLWQEAIDDKHDDDNSIYVLGFVGGIAANVEGDTRNGLNYGVEAHFVLKQEHNFGVDFGMGAGYSSLSLPGGKTSDLALTASVGFTDNKYIYGGMIFTFDATEGNLSPSAYLAFTYPLPSTDFSLFCRGSLGLFVTPETNSYFAGRGQVGAAYHFMR